MIWILNWKIAFKTNVSNKMLCNKSNEAALFSQSQGKTHAESTAQTSQIMVGEKILELVQEKYVSIFEDFVLPSLKDQSGDNDNCRCKCFTL